VRKQLPFSDGVASPVCTFEAGQPRSPASVRSACRCSLRHDYSCKLFSRRAHLTFWGAKLFYFVFLPATYLPLACDFRREWDEYELSSRGGRLSNDQGFAACFCRRRPAVSFRGRLKALSARGFVDQLGLSYVSQGFSQPCVVIEELDTICPPGMARKNLRKIRAT
jgi:hypothetical protein